MSVKPNVAPWHQDSRSEHLTWRLLENKDMPAFNRLYNDTFARSRTGPQCAWQFEQGPAGRALQLGLFDPGGQLVGHWGVLPNVVMVGSRAFRAGKTENTMLAPSYRGKGVYPPLARAGLERAWQSGFHLVWVSYSAAARAHERVGYRAVGPLEQLSMPIFGTAETVVRALAMPVCSRGRSSPRKLLGAIRRRLLVSAALADQAPFEGIQLAPARLETVERLLETWVAELASGAVLHYSVTLGRTVPYLAWRFLDNPHVAYHWITFHDRRDVPFGYVIWHVRDSYVVIDDLVLLKDWLTVSGVRRVLRRMVPMWRRQPVLCISMLTMRGSRMAALFAASGFRAVRARRKSPDLAATSAGSRDPRTARRPAAPRQQGARLTSWLLALPGPEMPSGAAQAVLDPSEWYATGILLEGVG